MKYVRDILADCAAQNRPSISYEFFPTKTPEGEKTLLTKTIPELLTGKPDFCSVTYGAGGGTRETTIGIVESIQRDNALPAVMHLTCVNSTRAQLLDVVNEARSRGIKNILALRGDPPAGQTQWTATEGGFEYSYQLVAFLKEQGGFSIGTAGFPEGHIAQAAGKYVDWGYLRDKVQAGADFVISQLYFDNADFLEFRDHLAKKLGVNVPILPGILPALSRNQTKRFTTLCGAKLPETFLARIEELGDDDAGVTQYGIEYAVQQCAELLREGVPGLHFYTLNKSHSTLRVLEALGLKSA
jgi:methylenetetrahydrofolate reductase (NADPH)